MFIEAENDRQKIQNIYYAAIASPQKYSQEIFNFFETVFSLENADLRSAAILATGYIGWSEFEEILQQVQLNDPNSRVRNDAHIMLDGMKKQERLN